MKALFTTARKNAQEISEAGIALMYGCLASISPFLTATLIISEEARAKAKKDLHAQTLDSEKDIEDVLRIFKAHDASKILTIRFLLRASTISYITLQESVQCIMAHYQVLFEDLIPLRVTHIDSASATSTFSICFLCPCRSNN